jgi:hypothetical protein
MRGRLSLVARRADLTLSKARLAGRGRARAEVRLPYW